MKKYKEDIENNQLFKEISRLDFLSFDAPNRLNYEIESVRKESVNKRIKSAQEIRKLCDNLSKEEILDLITLGYK